MNIEETDFVNNLIIIGDAALEALSCDRVINNIGLPGYEEDYQNFLLGLSTDALREASEMTVIANRTSTLTPTEVDQYRIEFETVGIEFTTEGPCKRKGKETQDEE